MRQTRARGRTYISAATCILNIIISLISTRAIYKQMTVHKSQKLCNCVLHLLLQTAGSYRRFESSVRCPCCTPSPRTPAGCRRSSCPLQPRGSGSPTAHRPRRAAPAAGTWGERVRYPSSPEDSGRGSGTEREGRFISKPDGCSTFFFFNK